ncbi:hypothetical protein EYR36_005813 [Pleurotus pulmonarius]|nr:hypothetical protein EYR36_005813 [Pleurotus pulmonarius]KAF4600537.1 hypothetical protein EYR38_005166 [Pleurotus pulmonarius]
MSSFTPWNPIQRPYPTPRRSDHVDVYKSESKGDVRVPDPYNWLEKKSEETDEWIAAQEAFTAAYLDQNSDRKALEEEIRANTNFPKFSAPGFHGNRWYWFYNSGLQAQTVLYRSKDEKLPDPFKEEGPCGEVFFDSNLLTEDGTAALADLSFSHCGKYFAYGISLSGSDFSTIYVRSTEHPFALTEEGHRPSHENDPGRFPEEVRFVKFSSIVWTHDSKGFFYHRYPDRESHGLATDDTAGTETEGDVNAMLCYHRIDTPQSEDILVHKDDANPEWMWSVDVSDQDGRYLTMYVVKDTSRKNLVWVTDLQENEIGPNMKWDKIVDEFEAEYEVVTNDGTILYIKTNKDAPQHHIVTVDLADPKRERRVLIPEDKDANLVSIKPVNHNKLVVVYKRNVKDEVYIYSNEGKRVTRIAEDFVGAATISARKKHSWFFVSMVGFNTPNTVGRYVFDEEIEGKRWNIYRTTPMATLDPDEFIATQVWYPSKDGTKVPMFIVRHKDTQFDGTAPAIQYGYGGFTISIDPFFSPAMLTMLKKYGAVLAVPNIRGGGEFGEAWHQGGIRERKVNVFDDFIAATEYLVKHKYAAPGKVAINGGSNGGLLVAACVNRAPEGTFGAAVAEVGVLDLLKFHLFTIVIPCPGKAWTSDYGNPSDPHDFDFIHPISPLHNVPTDRVLPPTILLTADHDDRVVPLHSFKHAATLQHTKPNNPHPLLIRIDKKAGHGSGKSTDQRIKEAADKWGFVVQSNGWVAKQTEAS